MTKFEYYSVFESILFGLALAHILISISKMIVHRKTIKFYWGHSLMVLSVLLTVAQRYYLDFDNEEVFKYETIGSNWEFLLFILLPMSLFFVMTYLGFPENFEGVDFEELLWTRGKEISVLLVLLCLSFISQNIFKDHHLGLIDADGYLYSFRFLTLVVVIGVLAALALFHIITGNKIALKILVFIIASYNLFLISVK